MRKAGADINNLLACHFRLAISGINAIAAVLLFTFVFCFLIVVYFFFFVLFDSLTLLSFFPPPPFFFVFSVVFVYVVAHAANKC